MCLAGDIMSDLVAVSRVIQDHIGGPFSPFVSVPIMLRAGLEKVGSDPALHPAGAWGVCSGH